jgi:hypothetical protein
MKVVNLSIVFHLRTRIRKNRPSAEWPAHLNPFTLEWLFNRIISIKPLPSITTTVIPKWNRIRMKILQFCMELNLIQKMEMDRRKLSRLYGNRIPIWIFTWIHLVVANRVAHPHHVCTLNWSGVSRWNCVTVHHLLASWPRVEVILHFQSALGEDIPAEVNLMLTVTSDSQCIVFLSHHLLYLLVCQ